MGGQRVPAELHAVVDRKIADGDSGFLANQGCCRRGGQAEIGLGHIQGHRLGHGGKTGRGAGTRHHLHPDAFAARAQENGGVGEGAGRVEESGPAVAAPAAFVGVRRQLGLAPVDLGLEGGRAAHPGRAFGRSAFFEHDAQIAGCRPGRPSRRRLGGRRLTGRPGRIAGLAHGGLGRFHGQGRRWPGHGPGQDGGQEPADGPWGQAR